jgi:CNT family concentrative nucleoside transporter
MSDLALRSALGLLVLAALAYALSENRSAVPFRHHLKVAAAGLAVQLVLAVLFLKVPIARDLFRALNGLVHALQAASESGTGFVFGFLGGGPLPFEETRPGASFVLAFRALPLILVVSALSALLFYWRVLPLIVRALSWLLQKSLGVGGAVGLGAAANVFVGMVEAPLLIRPFVARLSRGELFAVMTCGMATIAGTVLALYATILGPVLPDALGQLLVASILSAPAAITVARLMVPDAAPPTPAVLDRAACRAGASSAMDAVTRGTLDGVKLLINVTAMLIVLVALVHLCNQVLALLPEVAGGALTLQRAFGWAFAPLAWLMGLPWDEAVTGGALIGTKTVLNELIAYLDLAALPDGTLSPRSRLILIYALCGFANFGSLGIMIGGLATLVPERRGEVVALGLKSLVAGTIATCMTGAVVGLLTW